MTGQEVALGDVMALDLDPYRVEAGKTYPNIGIYSFGRGTFGKSAIDAAETSASTLYRVRAGQIIYSRLFAFEGAYASVPTEHEGAFVSNEFPLSQSIQRVQTRRSSDGFSAGRKRGEPSGRARSAWAIGASEFTLIVYYSIGSIYRN